MTSRRRELQPPALATSVDGDHPVVSLLVAMRNEEQYIDRCLASIRKQDYPRERLEVLILDGLSSDNSWSIASRLAEGEGTWRVVTNPGRIQSAAWNLGLTLCSGQIVGIVSAHAELAPDYVTRAVRTLERTGADLVGGPVRAYGETTVAAAISQATSSRFGIGNATFHYATKESAVDTVFMGVAARDTFERVGRFDECLVRNQDDEFSYRILDAGGQIICDPLIQSRYYSRATLGGLARQYLAYGYWKIEVIRKHPRQTRFRHLVPGAFVLTWLSLAIGTFLGWDTAAAAAVLLAVYTISACSAAAMRPLEKGGLTTRLLVVLAFGVLHLSYGAGLLWGATTKLAGRFPATAAALGVGK